MSYRDPINASGKGESPIEFTLTWNAWAADWRGKATLPGVEESCLINAKNLVGVIIEPLLYRVTGKSEPSSPVKYNLYSTFAKHLTCDTLKVYRAPKGGGKSELVAEGIWKDIEKALPPGSPRPKFTKAVMVGLRQADVSIFEEEEKGKPGPFKTVRWDEPILVCLNMTGYSGTKGFKDSIEGAGHDPDNCTGMGFGQNSFISVPNQNNASLPDSCYPVFVLQNLPREGSAGELYQKGGELFEKLDPWLNKMWGEVEDLNPVSFKDEDPDEKDVKNDGDLPF